MRYKITSILLVISFLSFGQKNEKLSLLMQVQPELTMHKNDYAFRLTEKKDVITFNLGLNASLQYKISERLFIDLGVGYISRKLNTNVFVDQKLLPPPYYDLAKPLYVTKSVSFSTFQIPIGIGYNFIKRGKTNFFAKALYVPNYMLATKYEVNNYPAFKKNTWQGHSVNVGLGIDYSLSKKVQLTNLITYSLANTVARDQYTFSQDEKEIALTHNYLQFSTGVKIKF